ncbi:MAG: TlpA disulfide reductase family protein [Phycisphaerales bacterium]
MKNLKSIILILFFLSFIFLTGCRKSTPTQQPNEPSTAKQETASTPNKINGIQEIIDKSRSWNATLKDFYGKEMPDFKLTDINGKSVSLKDYRGRNVMVVMWATWCQPCMQEVPHLNTLREMNPEDKLAILAISNESLEIVKKTVEAQKMQYTVIATSEQLPSPFSEVKNIPTTFFIRPDGTLKLVTEGSTVYGEMKAILLAE